MLERTLALFAEVIDRMLGSMLSQENQDEDGEDKGEIGPSQSTRRSRASVIHNLSERVVYMSRSLFS